MAPPRVLPIGASARPVSIPPIRPMVGGTSRRSTTFSIRPDSAPSRPPAAPAANAFARFPVSLVNRRKISTVSSPTESPAPIPVPM